MYNLNQIYKQISNQQVVEVDNKLYDVKNCVIATDGTMLKVSTYLSSADTDLSIFTEIRIIPR